MSLATLATRNLTTVLALILIGSPVWGLRPMRALRSALTSLPMPGMVNSPFFLVSLTASLGQQFQACGGLLVGDFQLLRHCANERGLGHSFCHVCCSLVPI